ncbi:hypothetical protein [Streptomyces sp. C184]|uniref:TRADD-N-associated membrane domain-containing protein n=1 Tax=Streptomyces sp. C184 TaxID=3237121 RepID=UPI0034C6330A
MSSEPSGGARDPDKSVPGTEDSGKSASGVREPGGAENFVETLNPDSARSLVYSWTPDDGIGGVHPYRLLSRRDYGKWYSTAEGKGARESYIKSLICTAAAFIVSLSGGIAAIIFAAGWPVAFLITLMGLLTCVAFLIIGRYKYRSAQKSYLPPDLDEHSAGEESARWLRDLDLQNLIEINRQQMKVYQEIATRQAKFASRSCQISIIFGFLVLITGAALALNVVKDPAAKIVVSALTVIGSAVSTYISKTFFEAQKLAMRQLNLYYRQPLVTSYVLQAERLTNRLEGEEEKQHKMVESVVDGVLAAARNAYEGDDDGRVREKKSNRVVRTLKHSDSEGRNGEEG